MTDISWNDFRDIEPPRLNAYYIVEDIGGQIYIDKWIHEDFWCGPTNEHIENDRWENTCNPYIKKWKEVADVSLYDYIVLSRGIN